MAFFESLPITGQLTPAQRARQAHTGLVVLMGAMSSLFFLFTVAFLMRSQYADFDALSSPWNPMARPTLLWLNTGLLVLASIAMQAAKLASREQLWANTRTRLLLGGLFGVAFILGQLWVWQQLLALGFSVRSNPANAFFYLLTGIHALHVVGGVVAWYVATGKLSRQHPEAALSVSLCARYWHFLLAVWLVFLWLLTSSPDTFAAIAEFCGFYQQ